MPLIARIEIDRPGLHGQCISEVKAEENYLLSLPVLSPESCEGCGLCCEGIGSPIVIYASRQGLPHPHPFRPVDLPLPLIEEIDFHFAGLMRGQEPQDRCLWFDPLARQCRHYEFRPQVCRDYELTGRACLQRRRAEAVPPNAIMPIGPCDELSGDRTAIDASSGHDLDEDDLITG